MTNTSLIVSYLGYETRIFQTNIFTKPQNIYLSQSTNELDEVVIQPDNWSREKKLKIF